MTQPPAVPQTPSARTRMMSVISGMMGGLAWFVVFGVLVFIVPKFVAVFADAKSSLPLVTQAVITAAHFLFFAWPLAAVFIFGVPGAAVLLSVFARSSRGVTAARWLGLGSVLFSLVVLVVILTSLLLPLMSLVEAVKQ
jgi:hypothetical protein